MKKIMSIIAILCMAAMMLSLTACGEKKAPAPAETTEAAAETTEALEETTEAPAETVEETTEAVMEEAALRVRLEIAEDGGARVPPQRI